MLLVCLPPWRPGKRLLKGRDHSVVGGEPGSICMDHPCIQNIMCTLGFPGVPKQNSRRPGWCFLSSVTQVGHPQRGFSMHEDLLCSDACLVEDSEASLDSFPLSSVCWSPPDLITDSETPAPQYPSTVLVLAGLSLVNESSV